MRRAAPVLLRCLLPRLEGGQFGDDLVARADGRSVRRETGGDARARGL